MKNLASIANSSSYTMLTGTILVANLNYTGIIDYAIKAAIGGAIWLGFKIVGDYIAKRIHDSPPSNHDPPMN